MDHTSVRSSNLKSVGYDPDTNTLEIMFKKGGKKPYIYSNVTQEQYDKLMNARSKGQYFSQHFRDKSSTRGR